MTAMTELLTALAFGLVVIVGGSICYNILVHKQNKKGRRKK